MDKNETLRTLFTLVGFKIHENYNLYGYPIDLFCSIDLDALPDDFFVACNFLDEDSERQLRDHLVYFNDIKVKAKLNKIILVISGIEVLGEDRMLADQFGIVILEESNLPGLINACKEEKGIRKFLELIDLATYMDPNIPNILQRMG